MDKVQLSCLILGIIICLAGNFVHSWAVDGYYECCCKDCSGPVRGTERGCFPCRSKTYHCDCVRCSCFPSPSLDQNDDDDSTSFIQMLLRGGFSSSSRLKRPTAEDVYGWFKRR